MSQFRIVYTAVYHRNNLTIPSLESIHSQRDQYDILVLSVNGANGELEEYINRLDVHRTVAIIRNKSNIGKAKAINKAVDVTTGIIGSHNMCHIDSDMIVEEEHFFDRGFSLLECEHLPIPSIIATMQSGTSCHAYRTGGRMPLMINKETLRAIHCGKGVAGGCLYMDSTTFIQNGGYAEDTGVYGGNESSLFCKFPHKKNIFVCETLSTFHQQETDAEYQAWKDACQERIRSGEKNVENGFYDSVN